MKLAGLYSHLKKEIKIIEDDLEKNVEAQHPVLKEASKQLLKAGGKRIRPVFVLLCAQFGDYKFESVKRAAVALELIHMASLVHDDVIDDAELRRGKKTVKAQWDNRVAMYTGDYLFARSLEYLTYLNRPQSHKILSDSIKEMCIGEIQQIKDQYNLHQNLRDYLRRIRRKTALLISVSCEIGAVSSDSSLFYQKKLKEYGYNVGMAFQITDDILDFIGTEDQLGKPAGGDLKQGNITLPALYAMNDQQMNDKITNFIHNPTNEELLQEILADIRGSEWIERSKELSNRYLEKAYRALDELPDIRARKTLLQIAQYIGRRNH